MSDKQVVSTPADVKAMLASLRDFFTYRRDDARSNGRHREADWLTRTEPIAPTEDHAYWMGFYAGLGDAYTIILEELDRYRPPGEQP